MRCLAALTSLLLLAACSTVSSVAHHRAPASPDPAHSSRNALDWPGTYAGTLPCADCPGIELRLTLNDDGSYQLATRHIDRQTEPEQISGSFSWTYDGNHIQLDDAADHAFYAVREGSLLRRYADGSWPQADRIAGMSLTRQP
ncbi:copper resistance protein NlpE [Xanthomonadaceae bacterium XH05]|nr:copper resistance protein NlpE [Xanthomonadaceae bacterium XH05]